MIQDADCSKETVSICTGLSVRRLHCPASSSSSSFVCGKLVISARYNGKLYYYYYEQSFKQVHYIEEEHTKQRTTEDQKQTRSFRSFSDVFVVTKRLTTSIDVPKALQMERFTFTNFSLPTQSVITPERGAVNII